MHPEWTREYTRVLGFSNQKLGVHANHAMVKTWTNT